VSDGVKDPLSSTDALLVRLSNEIERVQSRITALRKHTAVNVASRLRRQDLNRLVDPAERSAEESSSGDEGSKRDPAEPLRRRRFIFSRLNAIAKSGQSDSPIPAAEAMASPDSVAAEVMSPRITLSTDLESKPTRLGALRPPPLATPSLSLSLPESSTSESKPNSPITLLSPRVIPPVGSASFPTFLDDEPDTHADSVLRLAYVLCRSHPEWAMGNVVDVAAQLYLILVRKQSHPLLDGFAEEQTYWALEAIVRGSQPFLSVEVREPVNAIGRRVAWADRHFWSVLQEHRLDPVLYADHWVWSILAFLPPPALLPLWDLLLSEPAPRTDMVVDICAAMVLASKQHLFIQRSRSEQGLWADDDEGEIDPQRSLAALQAFPIEQIGTDSVLDIAFELRQARMVAELIGDDPDAAIEPSWAAKMSTKVAASDAAATVSRLGGTRQNPVLAASRTGGPRGLLTRRTAPNPSHPLVPVPTNRPDSSLQKTQSSTLSISCPTASPLAEVGVTAELQASRSRAFKKDCRASPVVIRNLQASLLPVDRDLSSSAARQEGLATLHKVHPEASVTLVLSERPMLR
jgi:hypothetical protein